MSEEELDSFAGTYKNSFIGNAKVEKDVGGLRATFENGWSVLLTPYAPGSFYVPGEDGVTFEFEKAEEERLLKMKEDGMWAFSAKKE